MRRKRSSTRRSCGAASRSHSHLMTSQLRVLDFDIENRPLAYWYDGATTAEITAIAACWMDEPRSMRVWLLGPDEPLEMLEGFLFMYNLADMVTGHYIRRHDLPILNGAM